MSGTSHPLKDLLLAKPLGCDEKHLRRMGWDGAEQPDTARVLTATGWRPAGAGLEQCRLQGELKLPVLQEDISVPQEPAAQEEQL